jgi:NodT family efflux transporter outer membrane factor (OMF) lipoprotein
MRRPSTLLTLLFAASTAGCMGAPPYVTPPSRLPVAYGEGSGFGTRVAVDVPWWQDLRDPMLNGLVEQALRQNIDVQQALATVREARAQSRAESGGGLPEISGDASAVNSRTQIQFPNPQTGRLGQQEIGTNSARGDVTVRWELDLFGRYASRRAAAAARLNASESDAQGARLALIADLVDAYVELRGTQRRLAIAQRLVAAKGDAVRLTRGRSRAGFASTGDLARADDALAVSDASLPPLRAQEDRLVFAIATLVGRLPRDLERLRGSAQPLPVTGATPDPGIPADLLRRRPDVAAAEQRYAAAVADVGVARADLYPTLSLSGTIGLLSQSTSGGLGRPDLTWSYGPALSLPIFDFGARRAQVDVRRAQAERARLDYEEAVLLAVRDLETALSDHREQRARVVRAQARLTAAERGGVASRDLYRAGITSFLDVLTAEDAVLAARDALAVAEEAAGSALVTVYRNAGGGWAVPITHQTLDPVTPQ